jgi:choline dehydrogenase-like flavoprotein
MDRQVLPRAAAAGARVLAGCQATAVAPGQVAVTLRAPDGAARGALTVRAQQVVLCGGAVSTPALLLDSGIDDGQIGRGLHLHPNLSAIGMLGHRVQHPGSTQGHAIDAFDDDDILIEAGPMLAGGLFQTLPLHGVEGGRILARANRVAVAGLMFRDVLSEGQVFGSKGAAKVSYSLHPEDVSRMALGLRRGGQLWLEGGRAEWVGFSMLGAPLCRTMDEVARLTAQLTADRVMTYSSHPQSSCAIGRVCDRQGQLRAAPGLWCADASALPSAVGRNPQISVMTMGRLVAEHVARTFGAEAPPLLARPTSSPHGVDLP